MASLRLNSSQVACNIHARAVYLDGHRVRPLTFNRWLRLSAGEGGHPRCFCARVRNRLKRKWLWEKLVSTKRQRVRKWLIQQDMERSRRRTILAKRLKRLSERRALSGVCAVAGHNRRGEAALFVSAYRPLQSFVGAKSGPQRPDTE
jgi:hypothetical protein